MRSLINSTHLVRIQAPSRSCIYCILIEIGNLPYLRLNLYSPGPPLIQRKISIGLETLKKPPPGIKCTPLKFKDRIGIIRCILLVRRPIISGSLCVSACISIGDQITELTQAQNLIPRCKGCHNRTPVGNRRIFLLHIKLLFLVHKKPQRTPKCLHWYSGLQGRHR